MLNHVYLLFSLNGPLLTLSSHMALKTSRLYYKYSLFFSFLDLLAAKYKKAFVTSYGDRILFMIIHYSINNNL